MDGVGTVHSAEVQPVSGSAQPSQFDSPYWTGAAEQIAEAEAGFVGVRFQRAGKIYHYLRNGLDLKVGNWVIVDTPRGKQMGQVATFKPPRNKSDGPFKNVERLATGRDMAMRHYYENKELEAMIACRAEASALGLPIKIVRAEYSFDGQTLTFLFSTDQEERVDTGELRQVMSRLYRSRIELRQISPREVAKILGGMGACGIEERCCSRFLTEFSPISIKHAKEQNLSLNPHDITGMCGRLRCCLVYEFEQYVEARRHLPKKNAVIGTPLGQGKVVEVLPLRDSVRVRIGEGEQAKEYEFHREQLVPLEELKRLQDKALSGACDKHENGQCDCGKGNVQPTQTAPQPPQAQATIVRSLPAAETAPVVPAQPVERTQPGVLRAGKKRKRKKGAASAGASAAQRPSLPSSSSSDATEERSPSSKRSLRKPLRSRRKKPNASQQ
ncbi:MAG: regulatory iron-sulfur-containing complex subunit RicT [Anaerolineae bacterium]|nr:hypothetical protein [Thermoflexales bacterium]MDW8407808.1 regulatory iron-sulfur-containing complex subunit RicT [Anaerolineae bacterium]